MAAERSLAAVGDYMEFWGWSDGGKPGSSKTQGGKIIARYGDSAWIADIEKATAALQSIAERLRNGDTR